MSRASHIRCSQVAGDVAGVAGDRKAIKAIVEAFYDEAFNAGMDALQRDIMQDPTAHVDMAERTIRLRRGKK